jgi:predicted ABC-type ATPase
MKFPVQCVDDWLASEIFRSEGIATESNLVTNRDFEIFHEAKKCGMQTELYFVYVPLETAIRREQIRASQGIQNKIPEKTIENRYSKGLFNIQKHIDSGNIDIIMIYDNSRGKGEEQLLLHIKNGKTVYLHPELLEQEWFKSAGIKIPNMTQNLDINVTENQLKEELIETINNAREKMGKYSFVVSASPGGTYKGEIIEESPHHAVQKVSQGMGVIYELEKIPGLRDCNIGEEVTIESSRTGAAEIVENAKPKENNIELDDELEI